MDFMEITEDRHPSAATIIACQLLFSNWYDLIGEETIVDAILDCMVHTSYRIDLMGESLRKKRYNCQAISFESQKPRGGSVCPVPRSVSPEYPFAIQDSKKHWVAIGLSAFTQWKKNTPQCKA